MKAVMYHYVRTARADLPAFTYLHREDFVQQLQYLGDRFGFCDRQEAIDWLGGPATRRPPSGVVLTFDDGFAEHFNVVHPILEELHLWAIFYVPTSVFETREVLDVHRLHLLVGSLGGPRCLELLNDLSVAEMFPDEATAEFRESTYREHLDADEQTLRFKRMANYFVDYRWRTELIDRLIDVGMAPGAMERISSSLYLTRDMVRQLHEAGHVIGSHSVNHRLMSKLSAAEQRAEIEHSFETLFGLVDLSVRTWCHPYGGSLSYNDITLQLLDAAGVSFSFSWENREVASTDLARYRQALPRFDCNHFPFGQVSVGSVRPDGTAQRRAETL